MICKKLQSCWFLTMASVVLTSSNHAASASSMWSGWTSAPHDLLLVAEVDIHCSLFYSVKCPRMEWLKLTVEFSHHLAAIVEALPYAGPIQVLERPNQRQIRYDFEPVFLSKSILTQMMLAGTSIKAVTAVKNLIYSGTCCLDEVGFSRESLKKTFFF